jgi:GNAT superfamily N-acetyltransferase
VLLSWRGERASSPACARLAAAAAAAALQQHATCLSSPPLTQPLSQPKLFYLSVTSQCRGKGVGSALIASLAAQAGDTPLYLTTLATTAALYKRYV